MKSPTVTTQSMDAGRDLKLKADAAVLREPGSSVSRPHESQPGEQEDLTEAAGDHTDL